MRWITTKNGPMEPTPKHALLLTQPLSSLGEARAPWDSALFGVQQASKPHSLTRSGFVCRSWNQVEKNTNKNSSSLSLICPLTAYLGKERNLLLDTLCAFTKGLQKKERSHGSVSLFPAGSCPAYCQSSPEYLYHNQSTDCALSQTASQSDFSQPSSCYSSPSFPRAQLHSH